MPTPYTVKAGETLNGIANAQGFKNYKEAGVTSVPSGNFDLVRPGDVINFSGTPTKTLVEPGVYKTANGYVNSSGASIQYSPIIQTTTSLDKKDMNIGMKIDNLANPQNPANNPTPVNGSPANPNMEAPTTYKTASGVAVSEKPVDGAYAYRTPTTLQAGEKTGYGTDGKRYIIGKDGTVRNDTFADQEYKENEQMITREKERTELYDTLQKSVDTAHGELINSIKKTFAVRRAKMQAINDRYLALKENQGFSGGQARYMSDINNGILQDEEQQGEMRLAELDAQEKTLIAQAVQAKSNKDFELATKKLDEIDKLQKEKQDTIQKVYKAAVDYNKALDDQAKEIRLKEKEQFDMGTKTLTASAPALSKAYDSLKTVEEKTTFLNTYAKKLGVQPEMVLGAIEDQRTQNTKETADINAKNRSNQPKAGNTTVDDFGNEITMTPEEQAKVQKAQDFFTSIDKMIASGFKNSAGVPVATAKGYLTYAAFKDLLTTALDMGITREEFLNRYQSKLNLSTFSGGQSGYGLTDAEYNKIKKSN